MRSRVSRFLAWGLGWRAACFLLQGSGSGTGEGRERGGDVGGPEARPGKGVRSWEPPVRVGPIGSLVLRPKPSPIGLAYFFPEGADRAGTQGFSLKEWGAWGPPWTPEATKLRTSMLRGGFHCERWNGKLLALFCASRGRSGWCRRASWAQSWRGPRGWGQPPVPEPGGGASGGAAAESSAFREKGPFAD